MVLAATSQLFSCVVSQTLRYDQLYGKINLRECSLAYGLLGYDKVHG